MNQTTVTYQAEPVVPGTTFRRNGRERLQGMIILKGKYKGCKIIDDDYRKSGNMSVIVDLGYTTDKIPYETAKRLVKNN